ncbi:uncharacterized protein LOC134539612 [Bacillus rossius redtenbacheri]|uniref:uncharacterized protein LOC134539612 n=1 Tax=Bacillus rossius redtenbacheri TaxID=93214 RepID=UPI002FDD661A
MSKKKSRSKKSGGGGARKQEVSVHEDSDSFYFRNGDYYSGQYRATSAGDVVRQGEGRLVTADRHVYRGQWDADSLSGPGATLRFPDGSEYRGELQDLRLQGAGCYLFPDGSRLEGHFAADRPSGVGGAARLADPGGRPWAGAARASGAALRPVLRFLPAPGAPDPDTAPPARHTSHGPV